MLLNFNAENNLSLTNFTDKAMKACIWEIHGHKLVIKLGPESRHLYISPGF